jgi:hypothetical protein
MWFVVLAVTCTVCQMWGLKIDIWWPHHFCTIEKFVCLFRHRDLICIYSSPRKVIKGTSDKAVPKRMKNRMIFNKTKRFSGKPSGSLFSGFYIIFHFTKFCRTRYFKILNSFLNKNLKIDSSFFRFFYFNNLKFSNLTNRFYQLSTGISIHDNSSGKELLLLLA